MKKLTLVCSTLLLSLGLTGCGNQDKHSEKHSSVKSEKVKSSSSSKKSSNSSKSSSSSELSSLSSMTSSFIDSESLKSSEYTVSSSSEVNNNINTNLDGTAQSGKIIGNTKTHIYHTPDQHNYKISPENEVVFNNEQDAINAGYRKALR